MKMWRPILILMVSLFTILYSQAQCSVCTKTAEQLGEGPASALNNAIVYLMFTPLLIMAYIGYRWWKREKAIAVFEQQNRG